jgi:hypothetical protein
MPTHFCIFCHLTKQMQQLAHTKSGGHLVQLPKNSTTEYSGMSRVRQSFLIHVILICTDEDDTRPLGWGPFDLVVVLVVVLHDDHHPSSRIMEPIMEGGALNPFTLWANSIGLTPYEQSSINGGGGSPHHQHHHPRDGSGRSYQSSRRPRRGGSRNNNNNNNNNGTNNGGSGEDDEDIDELVPSFHSARRTARLSQATCEMVGSMLGAGALLMFLPAAQTATSSSFTSNTGLEDDDPAAASLTSSSSSSVYYFPSQVLVKHPALVILVAILAERTGCLTLLAARYAGVNTLPDLVRVAFLGRTFHKAEAVVSLVFQLAMMISYQMLLLEVGEYILHGLNEIATSISEEEYEFGTHGSADGGPAPSSRTIAEQPKQEHLPLMLAVFGCVLMISPIFLQREFQYSRIQLFTTIATAFILATSSSTSSIHSLHQQVQHDDHLSSSTSPLVVCSWLIMIFCSHQVLQVQNALILPTRRRTSWTVSLSVTVVAVLLLLLAHLTVLLSSQQQQQQDNHNSHHSHQWWWTMMRPAAAIAIPNTTNGAATDNNNNNGDDSNNNSNADTEWWLDMAHVLYRMLGRIGCVPSLLLAYGMQLPSARRSLLHVIEFSFIEQSNPDQCHLAKKMCPDECCDEDAVDEETCVSFPSMSTWSTAKSHVDVIQVAPNNNNKETTLLLPRIEEGLEPCNVYTNAFAHYTSTAAIMVASYGLACLLHLLSVPAWSLWQWIAALFASLYSLALPAVCFWQIQNRQAFVPWRIPWLAFCYLAIAVACIVTLGATSQLVWNCVVTGRNAAALRTLLDSAIWW